MLQEMRLSGLGVIEDAVLDLGPGLTVITGETGAGKTMVVTGLGLLLGARADPATVRTGHTRAQVEGRFLVPADDPATHRAREAGADLDPVPVGPGESERVELIVARSVGAEGRSRAHLGGRGVPLGALADLADDLVAVHGQSEQLRLRSPARQREMLDRYAGEAVALPLSAYRTAWRRWQEVRAGLEDIVTRSRERAREADVLRLGLADLERVAPLSGEDHALRVEAERLAHAEDLRAAAAVAARALSGADDAGPGEIDALALLARARSALDQVRRHDPELAALADRIHELSAQVGDVALSCSTAAESVEGDPLRLQAVEERRAELGGLTRRYGEDVDAVLEWGRAAGLRLLDLEGDDDRAVRLHEEADELRRRLGELAGQVSAARARAAEELSAAVTAELADLAMPSARLRVDVSQREDPDGLTVDIPGSGGRTVAAGPDGVDDVELQLAPHRGAPFRPIARGASGGELSRVMLGLEVTLGTVDPVPTFVFDEVDAGVGGEAALGIGRRLARLSRHAQVLVVTHLPQVAAYADRHLVVSKSTGGDAVRSGVLALDDDERVRELARMLAGMSDSHTARAHAQELWQVARSDRGSIVA